jgi:hypothetical protein
MTSNRQKTPLLTAAIVGALIIAILFCLCLISIVLALIYVDNPRPQLDTIQGWFLSSPTPQLLRPTSSAGPDAPGQKSSNAFLAEPTTTSSGLQAPNYSEANTSLEGEPAAHLTPTPSEIASTTTDNLDILSSEYIPANDPNSLAQRLERKGNIPLTVDPQDVPYHIGDQKTFWVTNSETNENFQVSATLRYITDHAYFWIEDRVDYDPIDLARLAEEFNANIYPTTQSFFGSEWNPGIDGDPHLFVLYTRNLGSSIAGVFSPKNSYHPLTNEYSNAHEMFLLSADIVELDEEFAYGVLAHEYQHMIHWNIDRNEESWVNEGLSELASFLNGYGVGYHDYAYIKDPDIQLTDWPAQENGPHYGASFLFFNYFLNRFGSQATQRVVASPQNGMVSIDQVLRDLHIVDPYTNQPVRANDFFADWVLTTFLNDEQIEDGRYVYTNYPEVPRPSETETIRDCSTGKWTRDVSQYGVDYIKIKCMKKHAGEEEYLLKFAGSTIAPVLPVDAYSGQYYFWSNRGDEADMTLTREFDFTGVSGGLTFKYKTWFDLEKDYDYVYLLGSTDLGKTWEILLTPSGTGEDPSGNSYGWAYNGSSGNPFESGPDVANWIEESIDLSKYTGKRVLLRFEYVTDAAVHGEGMVLDDIAIPEINYFTDFEKDEGGWIGEGFVRINNILPQTYQLALISFGEKITIEKFSLQNDNILELPIRLDKNNKELVLVVSGTTPFTRHKTAYQLEIIPK